MKHRIFDTYEADLLNENPPRREWVSEVHTPDGDLLGYLNEGTAQRTVAALDACHGLDLPQDIPPGAVADLIAAAREHRTVSSQINSAQHAGRKITAGEWSDLFAVGNALAAALAPFAGQNPAPVSPEIPPDRRPIWSFEVDGQHVRWCGTLEQFHKDRIAYVDASQGEWETHGPNSYRFRDADGTRTTFRAVKQ